MHYIELDQFVGPNWLLTVHGPMDSEVSLDAAYVETRSIARKLDSARLRPDRADELSGAVVTALIGRLREFLTELTHESWNLERQVTAGHVGDPEQFLEELFGVRHGLLAARTVAVLSREVFGRMARLSVFGAAGAAQVDDLEDQLRRLAAVADSQREYLHGVIEFYQTRIGTKMTIAAERLAVIAAVTLPVTALSSVVGMNVIVNDETQVGLARVAAHPHDGHVADLAGVDPPQGLVVRASSQPTRSQPTPFQRTALSVNRFDRKCRSLESARLSPDRPARGWWPPDRGRSPRRCRGRRRRCRRPRPARSR